MASVTCRRLNEVPFTPPFVCAPLSSERFSISRGRRDIHDVLIGLAGRGVGILLCTHLLDDVDRLCHRIGVIVEGRTVAEGTIAELVRTTGHSARFRVRLAGVLEGRTIIEKFEACALEVGFAVILLTDDRGGAAISR